MITSFVTQVKMWSVFHRDDWDIPYQGVGEILPEVMQDEINSPEEDRSSGYDQDQFKEILEFW